MVKVYAFAQRIHTFATKALAGFDLFFQQAFMRDVGANRDELIRLTLLIEGRTMVALVQ